MGRRSDETSINQSAGHVWVVRGRGEAQNWSQRRCQDREDDVEPRVRGDTFGDAPGRFIGLANARNGGACWYDRFGPALGVGLAWQAGRRVGGGPNPNLAFCISGARHVKTGLGGGRMGEQGRLQRNGLSRGAWLRFTRHRGPPIGRRWSRTRVAQPRSRLSISAAW